MDTAGYITLTRQTGLMKELQAVSNNIANISTTGFRREGIVFAEAVQALDAEGGGVAMKKTFTGWIAKNKFEEIGGIDRYDGEYDFGDIYATRGNKIHWVRLRELWPPIKVKVTVETVEK